MTAFPPIRPIFEIECLLSGTVMSDTREIKDSSLGEAPSNTGKVVAADNAIAHDAVFGEITEDGPNYRSVCNSFPVVPEL